MPLSVVATLSAKSEFRADVRGALETIIPLSRSEAGCLQYDQHVAQDNPDSFVMIERWQDNATLDRHTATPHFAALLAAIDGKVADVVIVRLDLLA